MKFQIVGGDERAVCLAGLLENEGNEVVSFALDKADGIEKSAQIEKADCYILPLPVEGKRTGSLNAPLAETEYSLSEILFDIPDGSLVLGGKIGNRDEYRGLEMHDYMQRPSFIIGNAALTAEAAIWLLMNGLDTALYGKRALVIGFGRIGRILSQRLKAMNITVGVLSRNPEARAIAGALGYESVSPEESIESYGIVINTAPGAVLHEGALSALRSDCVLVELASSPGGINKAEAEKNGLRYIAAPGLPGRYSPKSAAELIFESVKEIINGKA